MTNPSSKPPRKNFTPAKKYFCYVCCLLFLATRFGTIGKLMIYDEGKKRGDARFAAVKIDWALIDFLSTGGLKNMGNWNGNAGWHLNPWMILLPLIIIDLPVSLVTDIVMFPLDQYYHNLNKKPEKIKENDEKQRKKEESYLQYLSSFGNPSSSSPPEKFNEQTTNHVQGVIP